MKDDQIQAACWEALPKPPKVTFANLFASVAGFASLAGLFVSLTTPDPDLSQLLFTIFLILLSMACVGYTAFQAHKKFHRYSETVYFQHFVNHIIRDYMTEAIAGTLDRSIDSLLNDILSAIANCFSMVTGKRCRCCLKYLHEGGEITTEKRDKVSAKDAQSLRLLREAQSHKHMLPDNTDFHELFRAVKGRERVFFSNNLRRDYAKGLYKNSSFEVLGKPNVFRLGGLWFVTDWNLPYRSAIVLPIRRVREFNPSDGASWKVWGFLCIDCNSTNVFDYSHCSEMGAAFADLLYAFFDCLQNIGRPFPAAIEDQNQVEEEATCKTQGD